MVVGEFTVETDLVVIGGGPGGYSAAFRAAELGIDTTIVDERPSLGGTWLHDGCVLSKDLVHITRTMRCAQEAAGLGVSFDPPRVDLDRMRAVLRGSVDTVAKDLEATCRAHGIARVRGRACFDNSRQLTIADNTSVPRIRFRRAVLASGTCERGLADVDIDSARVLTTAAALALPDVPPELLVVGGATSALELAGVYAVLGSRVTVVEPHERLVPFADDDLVQLLHGRLETVLEEIVLRTTVAAIREEGDRVVVEYRDVDGGPPAAAPRTSVFDRVIVATGRRANHAGLGLERTGVTIDARGAVVVDEQLRTTDPRILAVGDVVGDPMLARRAVHHGRIAAEVVAGWGSVCDLRAVPTVIFTDPELAWCGLTETQATASGQEFEVRATPWVRSGWSPGLRGGDGLTKILFDPDTRLVLGVGIVGAGAAELVGEAALAIEMGAVTADLAATLHAHPTHSEAISTAALRAENGS